MKKMVHYSLMQVGFVRFFLVAEFFEKKLNREAREEGISRGWSGVMLFFIYGERARGEICKIFVRSVPL